jgi:hypothetical protein
MQCSSIKSPQLWYGSGFFLKIRYYYAFNIKLNAKQHISWMKFHPKTLNILIVLNLSDVYQYHTP